ncbi:hypothetical protein D3C79_1087230 [compost metagenome]
MKALSRSLRFSTLLPNALLNADWFWLFLPSISPSPLNPPNMAAPDSKSSPGTAWVS